jgi:hypothetical protein
MATFSFEVETEIRDALGLLQEAHLERSRAMELRGRIRETIAHSRELMERTDIALALRGSRVVDGARSLASERAERGPACRRG